MDDNMENISLIQEMILISIKKLELMRNILDVTKRQSQFIELGKIDTVNKQIKLKDKYISEVNKLDIKFFSLYSKLKLNLNIDSIEKIDVEKYPQVKKLKEVVAEILKIMQEIKEIDDDNISRLNKDKNNLSNKLKGIRQGKKATNAYGAYKNQVKSVFFDRKK